MKKLKTLQEAIAEMSPEAQQKIQEKTEELLQETGLMILRNQLNISQKELAEALGVSQPAIAQMEQKNNDPRLSSLKKYINAMGGQLKLAVTMPTGEERIFRI